VLGLLGLCFDLLVDSYDEVLDLLPILNEDLLDYVGRDETVSRN